MTDAFSSNAENTLESLLGLVEAMRAELHQRLDVLAKLAESKTQARYSQAAPDGVLSAKVKQLEKEKAQLVAELERLKESHRSSLEPLEHDRQLLANAWSRLEREQIRASRTATPKSASVPVATTEPESIPPEQDKFAMDVLRQFQALRRDVRGNATRSQP
jgi:DNA repair exonuclease SbcCD ATPase subunit